MNLAIAVSLSASTWVLGRTSLPYPHTHTTADCPSLDNGRLLHLCRECPRKTREIVGSLTRMPVPETGTVCYISASSLPHESTRNTTDAERVPTDRKASVCCQYGRVLSTDAAGINVAYSRELLSFAPSNVGAWFEGPSSV